MVWVLLFLLVACSMCLGDISILQTYQFPQTVFADDVLTDGTNLYVMTSPNVEHELYKFDLEFNFINKSPKTFYQDAPFILLDSNTAVIIFNWDGKYGRKNESVFNQIDLQTLAFNGESAIIRIPRPWTPTQIFISPIPDLVFGLSTTTECSSYCVPGAVFVFDYGSEKLIKTAMLPNISSYAPQAWVPNPANPTGRGYLAVFQKLSSPMLAFFDLTKFDVVAQIDLSDYPPSFLSQPVLISPGIIGYMSLNQENKQFSVVAVDIAAQKVVASLYVCTFTENQVPGLFASDGQGNIYLANVADVQPFTNLYYLTYTPSSPLFAISSSLYIPSALAFGNFYVSSQNGVVIDGNLYVYSFTNNSYSCLYKIGQN